MPGPTIDQVQITSCDMIGLAMFADVTFPPGAVDLKVFAEIGMMQGSTWVKVLNPTFSLQDPDGDGRWAKSDIQSPCGLLNGNDAVAKAWAECMIPQSSNPAQSAGFPCDCDSMPGGPGGP